MSKKRTKKRNKKPKTKDSQFKIAIITGANSGVGYGVAQRLLDHSAKNPDEQFKVVLACRNQIRASAARNDLLKEFPKGLVEIVLIDIASIESVFKSCKEIKDRYNRVDLLFCNAGILQVSYMDWGGMVKQILLDPIALYSKTGILVQPMGKITSEGLGETFACNFFGHYVMIRELEDLLFKAKDPRVIWTGSHISTKESLNMEDYQCNKGILPYESSKRIIDIIGIGLNSRLNKQNIHSFTTHPGIVSTNIIPLGWVMSHLKDFLFYVIRTLGMRNQTITSWNGSYANYYVATQPIESLVTTLRYGSYCNPLGKVYVDKDIVEGYEEAEAKVLITKLETLLDIFRDKERPTNDMDSPIEAETETNNEETSNNNNGNASVDASGGNNPIDIASQNAESMDVDASSEWESRISRSRRMVYYYNRRTKESTWDLPEGVDPNTIRGYASQSNQDLQNLDPLEGGAGQIRASHLLVKHDKSRRPSSWKEALALIQSYHSRITSGEISLAELANTESDCSSAKRNGDLGYFGRGQMQPSFEEAAFKLRVGELSEPVWSDSGVHLILRTE
ncbi:2461_t:CDS:2 [Funneliformis geosporum]|uniref:WW domain-containing oxidoreductase n=1 Tax=Funneliformis geosporum TaxID=1117311 RepID=A0A9W4SQT7_9GLOM|nr:2461_t:CDS:2 [Funneliformis geosporum]